MSRNHQGRRSLLTSATNADNLLPSLAVFGCSLTAVEVETGPLSDVVFPSFLLPSSFSFPGTVPCTIILQKPVDPSQTSHTLNRIVSAPILANPAPVFGWCHKFRSVNRYPAQTVEQQYIIAPEMLTVTGGNNHFQRRTNQDAPKEPFIKTSNHISIILSNETNGLTLLCWGDL